VALGALFCAADARRALSATSLVTCQDNSLIDPSYFNVTFSPDTGALTYDISMTSEISDNVIANVRVYAYGFAVIEREIDMCTIGWKQFCPLYPGTLEIDSVEYIDRDFADMVPSIAYVVPDIDAVVRVVLHNANGTQLGCLQASFSNGRTVSHIAAQWATAVIAGIGLLAGALLSAFGNSISASHISANSISLFLYFQSVVVVCMQAVEEVPPIAGAWSENLAWSMGLIRVEFMQKIFRWFVQATGGTPTLYLTSTTISILVQRSIDFIADYVPFANSFVTTPADTLEELVAGRYQTRDFDLYALRSTAHLRILRGIERVGLKAGIEPTSIVCTGFTFFFLCGYVLAIIIVLFRSSVALGKRMGWIKNSKLLAFKFSWRQILKGALLRYIYIGFTQLTILSFWEFTRNDSPAVVVLAVLFLLLALIIMGWASYRTMYFGSKSIREHNNPAALLYGNPQVLRKYGFFYSLFKAQKYWFGIVVLIHTFIRCIFIGLGQGSGVAQALAFFIIDLFYTAFVIHQMPYLDKLTNIANIMICVVMTINSFLFLFFSQLFNQNVSVAPIMGWVFFILNAAFTVILLILIIVYTCMAIFTNNPDARFAPAKDDRTSFQRHGADDKNDDYPPDGTAELAALGQVAQNHQENWASEMYKLKDMVDSSPSQSELTEKDELLAEPEEKPSLGAMFTRKLTRGKSFKNAFKRGGNTGDVTKGDDSTTEVKRVSDTLLNFGDDGHKRTDSTTPIVNSQAARVGNDSSFPDLIPQPVMTSDFTSDNVGDPRGFVFQNSPSLSGNSIRNPSGGDKEDKDSLYKYI